MKRRLIDRIHDRAWSEVGKWLSCSPEIPRAAESGDQSSSISASMPWVDVCAAFADGRLNNRNFRRASAVRDIVETVGPVDGRFFARRVHEWGAGWATNPAIRQIDLWGNPIRWPGMLLGSPGAFSPTTLRYLATALWLKRNGFIEPSAQVIEIGVGFGGLAAMNALVSGAVTTLVDLPQVEKSAMKMLTETNLARFGRLSRGRNDDSVPLVISNYAFTELNSRVQEQYFDRYLKHAARGVIISNSSVFAASIRGRSDEELIQWFRSEGLPAKMETTNELLGPGDHLCGVCMIHW
jgi:hypothetical protein